VVPLSTMHLNCMHIMMAEVSHLNVLSFNLYIKISYLILNCILCMFTVPENVEKAFTELGYCFYNVTFDGDCAFAAIKYKYTKKTIHTK